jgi:hypothetical protein
MAGPTRLELATSCVTGRRSNQLNYDPAERSISAIAGPWHGAWQENTLDAKMADYYRQPNNKYQRKRLMSIGFSRFPGFNARPSSGIPRPPRRRKLRMS